MSNRLRSFLIVVMSIVIVAAALPLRSLVVRAGEGDDYWTITYDANNGSGETDTQQVTKGEKAQIAAISFEYAGHISSDIWKDAGGNEYTPGSSIDVTSDLTLYAQWGDAVTITFDPNDDGSGSMEPMVFLKDEDIVLSPNTFEPATDGVIFAGWNTEKDGTGTSYADRKLIKKVGADMTLYAQWKQPCVITFDKNADEASGEMNNQTIGQGYNTPLKANSFVYPGHVFIGWSNDPSATYPSWTDKGEINWGSDSVTLYAVWADERVITFNPNGAEGEAYEQKVGKGYATQITECKFTREFYKFDGWTTTPDGTTCSYWNNSTVTLTDNNLVLYAHWSFDTANCAKITFNKNGGQGDDIETLFVHKNTPAVLPANTYTKANQTFKCWNTQADGNGADSYDDKASITVDSDKTLYAQWVNNCTVTLHSNLESGDTTYDQTVGIGVATILDKDQFKGLYEHHSIIAWNTQTDGEGTSYPADEPFTTSINTDLYAVWKSYKVTFYDEDGTTELQAATEWASGETPVYSGEEPVKDPSESTVYKFSGWTPAITAVTDADQTYTATYSESVRKYTISFVDEDGTPIWSGEFDYGTVPVFGGTNPSKAADAQYTYSFAGWDDELTAVTGAKTYTATYSTSTNEYTITYYDEDGTTVLRKVTLPYGAMPDYRSDGRDYPTKPSTAQYSYKFERWDTSETNVTGNKSYTAVYKSTVNKYTITFLNDDGSVIKQYDVPYGDKPSCDTPSKERTQEYSYVFSKWNTEIVPVTGEATYKAVYTAVKNKYEVKFVNDNGDVLQVSELEYGESVSYKQALPSKASTPKYSYKFKGWDKPIEKVTEDVTYTAVFEESIRKYKITFTNEDGTVLQTSEVAYDEVPKYEGDTPTKSATVEYTFTFNGWNKDVVAVTGEAVYSATYTAKPITKDDINYKHFTVTFETNGGSAVVSQLVADGAKAFKPEEPMRERYTFGGWYIDVDLTKPFSFATPITSDITIYAKWIKGNQNIDVTYAVVGSGSIKWALESGEDLTITIERSQENETGASHLTGILMDGDNFYEYDLNDENAVVTLKAFELEKLSAGKHTVTFVFDDGQAEVELIVEDATKPSGTTATEAGETTETEAVMELTTEKNPSYIGLWIALGIVGLVVICALPILIVKRRTIK